MLGVEVLLTPLILNLNTRCTSGQLHTLALSPVPTEQEAEWGARIGLLRKQRNVFPLPKIKPKFLHLTVHSLVTILTAISGHFQNQIIKNFKVAGIPNN